MLRSLTIALLTAGATLAAGTALAAVIDPSSPTTAWTPVIYPTTPDAPGDHGTGDPGVDEATAFRFVMGTGTQPNALNQDVGASSGGWNDTTTWDVLGAISNALAPVPVPEPSPLSLVLLGLLGLCAGARRQRR